LVRDGACQLRVQRSYVRDGQVAVNRVDGLLDGSRDRSEAARVADFEVTEAPWMLRVRM
jgi:hypothetical protein